MKISKAMPNLLTTGGIFAYLTGYTADAINLGKMYSLYHSGKKSISPMVSTLMNNATTVSATVEQTLASLVLLKYGDKWAKISSALNVQYSPLENYNMTEEKDGTITYDDTDTFTKGETEKTFVTGAQENTYTKAQKHTTDIDSKQGVNSTTFNPNTKNERTEDTYTDTDNVGTKTDTETLESYIDTTDRDYEHTTHEETSRHGNIGVTSSQQLLESEIKIRKDFIFYDIMMKDIDEMITIPVYEDDEE